MNPPDSYSRSTCAMILASSSSRVGVDDLGISSSADLRKGHLKPVLVLHYISFLLIARTYQSVQERFRFRVVQSHSHHIADGEHLFRRG